MLSDLIKRALAETITDIGQLSTAERRELGRAVKRGHLSKGQGGPFPRLKTVYAFPGYDFAGARAAFVAEAMHWAELDRQAAERRRARTGNANSRVIGA